MKNKQINVKIKEKFMKQPKYHQHQESYLEVMVVVVRVKEHLYY